MLRSIFYLPNFRRLTFSASSLFRTEPLLLDVLITLPAANIVTLGTPTMPDSVQEFFWDMLQSSPWIRRTVFLALIGILFAIDWWNWSILGIIGFIWGLMEFSDLIFRSRRRS